MPRGKPGDNPESTVYRLAAGATNGSESPAPSTVRSLRDSGNFPMNCYSIPVLRCCGRGAAGPSPLLPISKTLTRRFQMSNGRLRPNDWEPREGKTQVGFPTLQDPHAILPSTFGPPAVGTHPSPSGVGSGNDRRATGTTTGLAVAARFVPDARGHAPEQRQEVIAVGRS
jgi:hypothetical protein